MGFDPRAIGMSVRCHRWTLPVFSGQDPDGFRSPWVDSLALGSGFSWPGIAVLIRSLCLFDRSRLRNVLLEQSRRAGLTDHRNTRRLVERLGQSNPLSLDGQLIAKITAPDTTPRSKETTRCQQAPRCRSA